MLTRLEQSSEISLLNVFAGTVTIFTAIQSPPPLL